MTNHTDTITGGQAAADAAGIILGPPVLDGLIRRAPGDCLLCDETPADSRIDPLYHFTSDRDYVRHLTAAHSSAALAWQVLDLEAKLAQAMRLINGLPAQLEGALTALQSSMVQVPDRVLHVPVTVLAELASAARRADALGVADRLTGMAAAELDGAVQLTRLTWHDLMEELGRSLSTTEVEHALRAAAAGTGPGA
jgi:hypothetical protein